MTTENQHTPPPTPYLPPHLTALDCDELLRVLELVRRGDFSVRMVQEGAGLPVRIANTLNDIITLQETTANELSRIGRVVGKEGKLDERAQLHGASGGWIHTVDAINETVSDLAQPLREITHVIDAVAKGNLTHHMDLQIEGRPLRGDFGTSAKLVNTMVDQLSAFSSEVTRVAREVGTEGKLGGQARVPGVSGTWKDLTDNVNSMADNLTAQVREIAEVTTAVATGDLSKKITVNVKGEILELKNTINTMVDQLSSFASEVTRVAREVGSEGKLGGQADVPGVSGTWKDLTDNVNSMAGNLTAQVREIAEVTTAVATGDLSKKITVDVKGEILELKNTINTMVDQLSSFASEVTRVAREVGSEGKLGGQAGVPGVAGVWKDLTDNVNSMADNLTAQVREIAEVTTAVATGDLSKKITVDVKGEILELKNTINTMVDQLSSFASEVTRVAREVGSEGELGGQADVPGVSGTWKDLTDNVNSMADNLTAQVREIAEVTTAVAMGDLSKKIRVDVKGEILELKNTINTMVDQLNAFASEVTRVAREVGSEGKLGGQADVPGVSGTWKDLTDNVNSMAGNLTAQVREIAEVTTAVATGDLSKKITVDVKGEILELKNTINTMVDQLSSFASEVTRVAREVGSEGKLGGQAGVPGVAGVWKDLTDNVNSMADNLTAQVRGIATVVTAVAKGVLDRKLSVEAKGEIAELANTINSMIDTLAMFADQVTTVAREVGIEGQLGGQAKVPGASGTWRDLTDNVNRLAANLTTQVRAIIEVTTAVAVGDLSKKITVEADGEVAFLKDNVNKMIRTLEETTLKTNEQDWLKTNLTRFTQRLQGQKELLPVAKLILSELAPLVNMQHGVFYMHEKKEGEGELRLLASYAYRERRGLSNCFRLGEGLVGQCALEQERILITDVPEDYVQVNSGLGSAPPRNIVVLPVLFEGEVKAVLEIASFHQFKPIHMNFLDQLTTSFGIVLNTIEANMRTGSLLTQSQTLTQELQSQQQELTETNRRLEQQAQSLQASEDLMRVQQEELKQTNIELEEKAKLLAEQKSEVETKNNQIELARRDIEEKVEQLALTSKYKSEFLANMSHELRTPLNSMLILSKMLSENPEGLLTQKQVEFAETIYSSGADLLELINEILDLSKIESGTMGVQIVSVSLDQLHQDMERQFRPVAHSRELEFDIQVSPLLPSSMSTDEKRLHQVLKNLLSNAFKFTHDGGVTLEVSMAPEGIHFENEELREVEKVLAFCVSDTGIGIEKEKHRVIFEAFQQADGTTARVYDGTGLGLSISREIARLLGGEIHLESELGQGSAFTLYLPLEYKTPKEASALEAPKATQEPTNMRDSASVSTLLKRRPSPAPAPKPRRPPKGATPGAKASHQSTRQDPADDRENLQEGDRVLLIVEDDLQFATFLAEAARRKGFKILLTTHAETALVLARRYKPDAITLDLHLPGMHGLALLDRLKHEQITRHIPVQIMSVADDVPRRKRRGAISHVQKPTTPDDLDASIEQIRAFTGKQERHLLIVEQDRGQLDQMADLIGGPKVKITPAQTYEEAYGLLAKEVFDCVVIDLDLPDRPGLELVCALQDQLQLRDLPVVVHTAKALGPREREVCNQRVDAVILKGQSSIDELLGESVLFLHREEQDLRPDQQQRLINLRAPQTSLAGKRVLIIDDDVRNIFAITSLLEQHKMKVMYAESGEDGIAFLQENAQVDVVLMDMMMPGMDGYQTTTKVRTMEGFEELPIIAVTAKAMPGDREKCIEAGCSDYLTKPINIEQLLSLLRVWALG